ncbi:methyl-accepting chemotaxis protein [Thiopseudomonas alkaliphila]|uniref:methyl-accepting chemotaxis protein n=1 Tax=Thiopseudomonas alkaliphila TaxID=1697053 RepID=UPI003570ACBA
MSFIKNMTVRLSWILVLAVFSSLVLVMAGLAWYALNEASAAVTLVENPSHTAQFNALAGVLKGVIVAVVLATAGIVLVVFWGVTVNVIRPLEHIVTHFSRIAAGDLSQPVEQISSNEVGQLYSSVAHMQRSLAHMVGQMRGCSQSIQQSSQDIAAGNEHLSARTEQQAAALQQTSASMEELTATVAQNAENARYASSLAVTATGTAQRGGAVVNNVVGTMRDINQSAHKITDIIEAIDAIAFQTNMLALNASVEAARAGEQGRGFAVVAGEVHNLAKRSADAAQEIRALIEASLLRVEAGTVLVDEAGQTMGDIVTAVQQVTDIMEEIASASREQSHGISQVNQAISQMDQVIQQNATLVEQAASAAASLQQEAAQLRSGVVQFKLDQDSRTEAGHY